MNWELFCKKISLSDEVINAASELIITEEEYRRLHEVYDQNHEEFLRVVEQKEKSALWFLRLYSRMACETYENYKVQRISEEIFWDTFQDVRFWCENYEREYGTYGLGANDWFPRHIDMTLFRLGRLQYEVMDMKIDAGEGNNGVKKGTPVINIHIPQGEPLCWTDCEESLQRAYQVYGTEKPYVCHSWLLFPELAKLLPEKSNIREFREHFRVLCIDYSEREAEWRLFGKVLRIIRHYPEDTILQRRAKEYLLQGNVLGIGWAILEK